MKKAILTIEVNAEGIKAKSIEPISEDSKTVGTVSLKDDEVVILDGNLRIQTAIELGFKHLPVCIEEDEVKTEMNLIQRIDNFINKYAAISPNYSKGETDKFTGPDPYQFLMVANMLERGEKPKQCFSDWGSGCYKPYTSKEGREEHDAIIKEVYKIINGK